MSKGLSSDLFQHWTCVLAVFPVFSCSLTAKLFNFYFISSKPRSLAFEFWDLVSAGDAVCDKLGV